MRQEHNLNSIKNTVKVVYKPSEYISIERPVDVMLKLQYESEMARTSAYFNQCERSYLKIVGHRFRYVSLESLMALIRVSKLSVCGPRKNKKRALAYLRSAKTIIESIYEEMKDTRQLYQCIFEIEAYVDLLIASLAV